MARVINALKRSLLLLHNSLCSLPCGVSFSLSLSLFSVKTKTAVSEFYFFFIRVYLLLYQDFYFKPAQKRPFSLSSDFSDSSGEKTELWKKPKTVHNLSLSLSLSLLKEGREMTRRAEFKLGFFVVLQFMCLLSLCESWFSSWIRVYKQKGFMSFLNWLVHFWLKVRFFWLD